MISSVRGIVLSASGTTAVIEVGGVGLAITVTPQHAMSLRAGAEAMVLTALIVREDDLALFGFSEAEGLRVFDLLRSVTGVGPKSAMGVLSAMTPDQVAIAVADDDDAAFRKVSGIGPKTAKLIVLSLTGKLLRPAAPATTIRTGADATTESLVAALVGLGWSEKVASQVSEEAVTDAAPGTSVQQLLRIALGTLGPGQIPRRDSAVDA
ncbi:Holliday junction DNA helicase subunit RuvA [Homoserinimonas aerilata]|uniref:Holliday junction branch migration complex subunit RuvA n=1 Tax=Homoserinimonas aerilata TaxID=1162970 RepID=A0A542YIM8_9MICO|nr:Holliday junction branch migration protein RuvA [Homoserinimonas aerilata]TQL47946.1 Holliday junction DNA helicase subunit RuvA [Homoserinimonas aerilata]